MLISFPFSNTYQTTKDSLHICFIHSGIVNSDEIEYKMSYHRHLIDDCPKKRKKVNALKTDVQTFQIFFFSLLSTDDAHNSWLLHEVFARTTFNLLLQSVHQHKAVFSFLFHRWSIATVLPRNRKCTRKYPP